MNNDIGKGSETSSREAAVYYCIDCGSYNIEAAAPQAECAPLMNLLAVIHRDGGHYTSEHEIEKSAKDAEIEVIRLRSQAEHALTDDEIKEIWSEYVFDYGRVDFLGFARAILAANKEK